jgi:predicted transcriptional regulator
MALADRREDQLVDHLLGDLEAPIMRLMWQRPAATVREILDALDAAGRSLAYTTVMTVMGRLAEKGYLSREKLGKSHRYRATMTREDFLRHAAARRVQSVIAEFGDLAIAQFLNEVSALPPERRRQLDRLAGGGTE